MYRFPLIDDHSIVPFVRLLLHVRRPPAILLAVWAVRIDPLYRQRIVVSFVHIFVELLEGLPFLANSDASAAVVLLVSLVPRSFASIP
jgi:hypothetical protein